jgi:hypothetical protein
MTYNELNEKRKTDIFTKSEILLIRTIKDITKSYLKIAKHLETAKFVVAGGFFSNQLRYEPHNDFDVFILDFDDSILPLYENEKSFERLGSPIYKGLSSTNKIVGVYNQSLNNIQYILTRYKTRQDLLKDFDFVHCMISYEDGNLYITRQMFDACIKKKLIANKPKDQIKPKRWQKFLDRGFREVNSI